MINQKKQKNLRTCEPADLPNQNKQIVTFRVMEVESLEVWKSKLPKVPVYPRTRVPVLFTNNLYNFIYIQNWLNSLQKQAPSKVEVSSE